MQFVNVPDVGVPRLGVVRAGEVARTTDPLPVEVVAPVPPLATARVPANVTAPVVAVDGVSPVEPALNDVTAPVDVTMMLAVEYHCVVLDALNSIQPLTIKEIAALAPKASIAPPVAG